MLWKKVAIAAVTGMTDGRGGWVIDQTLQAPAFKLGPGYRYMLPSTGNLQTPVLLSGQPLLDLLRKHEVVILQHHPPRGFIEAILAGGVTEHVLLWLDYDGVPAAGYWSPAQGALAYYMKLHRLTGTKPNRYGELNVDFYESMSNGPYGKPHAWAVNIFQPHYETFVSEFVTLVYQEWEVQKYRGLPVGLFIDNCLERPYFGTASNADAFKTPDVEQRYVKSIQHLIQMLRQAGFGPIMGNCGYSVGLYGGLDAKFDEMLRFGENQSQMTPQLAAGYASASVIQAERERGIFQKYCFNSEPMTWGPPQWRECHSAVPEKLSEWMLFLVARSGYWLTHPGPSVCSVPPLPAGYGAPYAELDESTETPQEGQA